MRQRSSRRRHHQVGPHDSCSKCNIQGGRQNLRWIPTFFKFQPSYSNSDVRSSVELTVRSFTFTTDFVVIPFAVPIPHPKSVTAMSFFRKSPPAQLPQIPLHPHYPLGINLPNYAANDKETLETAHHLRSRMRSVTCSNMVRHGEEGAGAAILGQDGRPVVHAEYVQISG